VSPGDDVTSSETRPPDLPCDKRLTMADNDTRIARLHSILDDTGGVPAAAVRLKVSHASVYRALRTHDPGPKLAAALDRLPGEEGRRAPDVSPVGSSPPAPQSTPPPAEAEAPAEGGGIDLIVIGAAAVGYAVAGPLAAVGVALVAQLLQTWSSKEEEPTAERRSERRDYEPRKTRPSGGARTLHSWEDPP